MKDRLEGEMFCREEEENEEQAGEEDGPCNDGEGSLADGLDWRTLMDEVDDDVFEENYWLENEDVEADWKYPNILTEI